MVVCKKWYTWNNLLASFVLDSKTWYAISTALFMVYDRAPGLGITELILISIPGDS
jgi:hypothetical protein